MKKCKSSHTFQKKKNITTQIKPKHQLHFYSLRTENNAHEMRWDRDKLSWARVIKKEIPNRNNKMYNTFYSYIFAVSSKFLFINICQKFRTYFINCFCSTNLSINHYYNNTVRLIQIYFTFTYLISNKIILKKKILRTQNFSDQ